MTKHKLLFFSIYAAIVVWTAVLVDGRVGSEAALPTGEREGKRMLVRREWKVVKELTVPAKPHGLWTLVIDCVEPSAILRIEAHGEWMHADAAQTTPDGDAASAAGTDGLLCPHASRGALIGKFGGSTAWVPPSDALDADDSTESIRVSAKEGHVFSVGSSCVIETTDTIKGPLYLTMNDTPAGLLDNSGEIQVKIFVGNLFGE